MNKLALLSAALLGVAVIIGVAQRQQLIDDALLLAVLQQPLVASIASRLRPARPSNDSCSCGVRSRRGAGACAGCGGRLEAGGVPRPPRAARGAACMCCRAASAFSALLCCALQNVPGATEEGAACQLEGTVTDCCELRRPRPMTSRAGFPCQQAGRPGKQSSSS